VDRAVLAPDGKVEETIDAGEPVYARH